jgi:alpha-galactosidase
MNTEVIAVNQDPRALPMRPVRRSGGVEVWKKPLVGGAMAVILFNRNATQTVSVRSNANTTTIEVAWPELGLAADKAVAVRDLWRKTDLGVHKGSFSDAVDAHEARIYVFGV